ncbi:MAG: metallophosphoesterase [Nitrospirae bacterium]|nr:metallophosphoesterase [Nitrospirota bacterium]
MRRRMKKKTKDCVKIAHISDLHFTKDNINDGCYETLRLDLLKEGPNVIVITGDIFEKEKIQNCYNQRIA